jgi:hypothetical protein
MPKNLKEHIRNITRPEEVLPVFPDANATNCFVILAEEHLGVVRGGEPRRRGVPRPHQVLPLGPGLPRVLLPVPELGGLPEPPSGGQVHEARL